MNNDVSIRNFSMKGYIGIHLY